MVTMLRCGKVTLFVVEHGLEADTQQQPSANDSLGNDVLVKENSFFLFSSLFKKLLFLSRFVVGVLSSLTLVCGSFPCR